jgi:hypothetical protein
MLHIFFKFVLFLYKAKKTYFIPLFLGLSNNAVKCRAQLDIMSRNMCDKLAVACLNIGPFVEE